MDEYDGADARTITVTLASGRPWDMPTAIAKAIIESMARANPNFFGQHLQAALMGEMPRGRGRQPKPS